MRAAVLLDLDEVVFVEPTLDRLTDDIFTAKLVKTPASKGRILLSEKEWPIAVALETDNGWIAGNFILREPTEALIEKLEGMEIEIYQEPQAEWEAAVREYFSLDLLRTVSPGIEDLSPARADAVLELLREVWKDAKAGTCLDAACGTGLGSAAARSLGMSLLSFDNDPSLLARGLRSGRLLPEETMWIDATQASRYIRPVEYGLLLMAGEITPFNSIPWRRLTHEVLSLSKRAILTTGTEKEGSMLRQWAVEKGWEAELIENDRDAFYDRWVCIARSH